MNKHAVKQLTKEGCIVEKDAAENLTEEDIEAIKALDSAPMYITEGMLDQLREDIEEKKKELSEDDSSETIETNEEEPEPEEPASNPEPDDLDQDSDDKDLEDKEPDTLYDGSEEETTDIENEVDEEPVEESEPEETGDSEQEEEISMDQVNNDVDEEAEQQEELGEDEGVDQISGQNIEIKDDRNRSDLRTKVEVMDERDISRSEKDVPEFLQYYNDRYDRAKKLLTRRMEMQSATTINRVERRDEGEEATTLGLVKSKYSTNSGKYIVELEDKTGTFKALVDEREGERIVPDEVIGVIGSMGGDIIYANSIVRPDLPIPNGVKTTETQVRAAYISDFHMGSIDTRDDKIEKFGKWLNSEQASDVGYLVIPGDLVEGVGTYPGQEDELEVTDIYKQYELFEDWVETLPERIQVVIGPGNHDITRLAEPQPRLAEKALPKISDFNNVHFVQNPQMVRLHGIESDGIKNLMYHGYSFDEHVDQIQELREKAYEEPQHVMIDLLKRRHLAPTYGSNSLAPEGEDSLVIEEKPDVFVAGHFHAHCNESYKGVNVINASSFQDQTDFQKRVGHEPDPHKVTLINYKNRNTEVKKF